MMSTRTRLHAYQARRQIRKERRHLSAPQLLAQDDFPSCIYPVNLQYVLRQIDAGSRNIHVGAPILVKW